MDALTDILALALAGVNDDAACAMLAKSIAALCGSPSFHLQRHTVSDAVFVSTHNLNADMHRDYVDHYWRHDLWANRFPVSLGPQVRDSESFISKDEWERSEIYNDLLRPNGDVYRCAGFVAPLDAASTLVAGVHRTRRQPAFAQEDLDRLQAIMPVLSDLVTARRRLEEGQPDLAARLLDVGPDPALALDADGAVRHQNRAAETAFLTGGPLARRGDGVASPARSRTAAPSPAPCGWRARGAAGRACTCATLRQGCTRCIWTDCRACKDWPRSAGWTRPNGCARTSTPRSPTSA